MKLDDYKNQIWLYNQIVSMIENNRKLTILVYIVYFKEV